MCLTIRFQRAKWLICQWWSLCLQAGRCWRSFSSSRTPASRRRRRRFAPGSWPWVSCFPSATVSERRAAAAGRSHPSLTWVLLDFTFTSVLHSSKVKKHFSFLIMYNLSPFFPRADCPDCSDESGYCSNAYSTCRKQNSQFHIRISVLHQYLIHSDTNSYYDVVFPISSPHTFENVMMLNIYIFLFVQLNSTIKQKLN